MGDQVKKAAGSSSKERVFEYDFVRFAAMVMVVAVHALMVVDTGCRLGQWYEIVGQAFLFTANAIFFMLSGRFNLSERAMAKPGRFYLRKVRGILLPVLVLFFARTIYNLWGDLGSVPHVLKTYAANVLGGFSGNEYWFVYMLVSMLVVAPLLAPAVAWIRKAGRQRVFMWAGLAWFAVYFACVNLGFDLGYTFIFGGFWFSFLMGPMVEEAVGEGLASRKGKVLLVGIVVACPLITLAFTQAGWWSGVNDNSPFYYGLSIALYAALALWGGCIRSGRVRAAISFCADHSFTVYMIHLMVMMPLASVLPEAFGWSSLGMHWVLTIAVLAICLPIAAIADRVAIRPLQRAFDAVVQKLVAD